MRPETTVLDMAFGAMDAAPDDDAARLRFYACLADTELMLLLHGDEPGGAVTPRIFDLEQGRFALVFDRDERLAAFADAPSEYAALPGRVIAAQLAGQGIGIGLNLGVAPSSFLIPHGAVDWLVAILGSAPSASAARIAAVGPPGDVPQMLLDALAGRLGRMPGLARDAGLAAVVYEDGRRGHLLAIRDAEPGAQPDLAQAVAETLAFSGIGAHELDVTFVKGGDALDRRMQGVALIFDMPGASADAPPAAVRAEPGSDLEQRSLANRPPRLR